MIFRKLTTAVILFLGSLGLIWQSQGAIPSTRQRSRAFAKGEIFPADLKEKAPLFKWELRKTHSKKGDSYRGTWSGVNGAIYAVETTELATDGSLKRYGIEQLQVGESGSVEVQGRKAVFSWKADGRVRIAEEVVTDEFVSPSTIPLLIRKKWNELNAGEKLKIRLAVLPWRETVGFYLKKIPGRSPSEAELELKPTNPIFSIFSPDIVFTISIKTKMIVGFRGPSLAKSWQGGKWKDVDVRALYRYL